MVEVGGGEPIPLTDAPLGVGSPRWSPDSRQIAYASRVPESGRYGTDEDIAADAEAPRLIIELAYRLDGVGYTNDRRNHLFVLDIPDLDSFDAADRDPGGAARNRQEAAVEPTDEGPKHKLPKARQITDGDFDDVDVSWSPDGSRLVFVTDRGADGARKQREDLTSSVFTCTSTGDELTYVAGAGLSCNGPQWTADGEQIVFSADELGERGLDFVARNRGLYHVPTPGDSGGTPAGPRRLTDAETLDLGEVGSHLSVSQRGVIVQDRRRGAVRLLEIDPSAASVDAETAAEIAGGSSWHRGHAVTPSGDTVVAAVADADRPGEVHYCAAVVVTYPAA